MKESRNKLGFTMEQMASFLGIPKSTVSMYEIGRRKLPAETQEKIRKILEVFNKNEPGPTAGRTSNIEIKYNERLKKKLKYIMFDAKLAILKGEKQLDIVNKNYTEQTQALHLIKLMQQEVDPNIDSSEKSHLVLAEGKCKRKLDECGIDKRVLLEFDLFINKCKIEKAKELLGPGTPDEFLQN